MLFTFLSHSIVPEMLKTGQIHDNSMIFTKQTCVLPHESFGVGARGKQRWRQPKSSLRRHLLSSGTNTLHRKKGYFMCRAIWRVASWGSKLWLREDVIFKSPINVRRLNGKVRSWLRTTDVVCHARCVLNLWFSYQHSTFQRFYTRILKFQACLDKNGRIWQHQAIITTW